MPALQDQLDEITANTRRLVQPERLAISERAAAELLSSGIEEKILPVGAAAPEFTLRDASGRPVRSADLLALGPLILKFFRGRWCPYCVTEIETWRELYPRLREAGLLFCAVSPQTSRQSDFMVGQHSLPFPVLSDAGCTVAEKFGLAYTIPAYHRDYYRSILVNIPFINGSQQGGSQQGGSQQGGSQQGGSQQGGHQQEGRDSGGDASWRLILPATYVISQAGRVVLAQAHADHRVRPEPEEVLAVALAAVGK